MSDEEGEGGARARAWAPNMDCGRKSNARERARTTATVWAQGSRERAELTGNAPHDPWGPLAAVNGDGAAVTKPPEHQHQHQQPRTSKKAKVMAAAAAAARGHGLSAQPT